MSGDADAILKRADKKMTTTLTRWKPDFEAAATLYEEAAGLLRARGRKRDALLAYEKCAEANERCDNDWHAGKHLEQCATLARDVGADAADVVAYAERACASYVTSGRAQRGAECLGKIAGLLADPHPDAAATLYETAVTMLEDEDKQIYAADLFRSYAAVRMRQGRHADAADVMLRFGAACDAAGQLASQRKAYLSAVVAMLYDGQGADAQATYRDVSDIPNFQDCDEHRVAYELIAAYRDADADAIRDAVERKHAAALEFLEPAFARAAKKLPLAKHNLRDISEAMGGDGGAAARAEGFLGGGGAGEGGEGGGRGGRERRGRPHVRETERPIGFVATRSGRSRTPRVWGGVFRARV
jgi:26S proteasome regulatory subunit T4